MLRAVKRLSCIFLLAWLGCEDSADEGPPPRKLSIDVMVDDSGLSEEVAFEVPEGTR